MSFCPENGYLYSVEWSPFRPCVFACGTTKGNILIYDLNESSSESTYCQVLPVSDSPVYTVSFNQQRAELMASGDKSGLVRIWQLSHNLIRYDASEVDKLNDISQKPFKNN